MSEEITQSLPNDTLRLILARLDSIDTRLTTLEEKVDRRLQETRPIWEKVLARVEALETGLAETRSEVRQGFEKLDDGQRKLERKIEVLNDNMLEVHADLRYMDRRIAKLESEPTQ
jgi:septal ring factor EnvC (AmiA/AmiB activator)